MGIAVLLKGRVRSSWSSFKRDGHADFFRAIIRILHRLAPAVFSHKRFPEIIQTILETFKPFAEHTNEYHRRLKNEIYDLVDKYFEYDYFLARRAVKNHASFFLENSSKNKHLLNCLGVLDCKDEKDSETSKIHSNNSSGIDLEKCRKYFCGAVHLSQLSEETLSYLKLIEDAAHRQDQNLDRVIDVLVSALQMNQLTSDVLERLLTVILAICKCRPDVCVDTGKKIARILSSGQNSFNCSVLLSSYTIDILLINLSENGIELLKSIFDALLTVNFNETDQQIKKLFRATNLEKIFASSDL